MNRGGLRAVSRMAVSRGLVRPSCSPGWAADVAEPGTKLYLTPLAMARQKTAFDGKWRHDWGSSRLPLERPPAISDCACGHKQISNWRSFMKIKTFSWTVRTVSVLMLVSALDAVAQQDRGVQCTSGD